MNKIKLIIIALITITMMQSIKAQETEVNLWLDHLPYNQCHSIVVANNKIYAASQYGIFYYDTEDESINRISKVNGLNDTDIAVLGYNTEEDIIVIIYKNANIDFIIDDEIINFPDIKRASITGDRSINNVMFKDHYAYLSCGFGIVVVDLKKKEVKDTYYIGPEGSSIKVNDITYNPQSNEFYAATEEGIYKADASAPNLAFYEYWEKITNFPNYSAEYSNIEYFNGKTFFNRYTSEFGGETVRYFDGLNNLLLDEDVLSDVYNIRNSGDELLVAYGGAVRRYSKDLEMIANIYTYGDDIGSATPGDCLYDPNEEKVIWIADRKKGIVKNINTWKNENFKVNGPSSPFIFDMDAGGKDIWVASGGRGTTFGPNYQKTGIYYYKDYSWKNLNSSNMSAFDSISDITSVAVDPGNSNHVYVGTWGHGLMEFQNGELIEIYNSSNSTIDDNINWDDNYQIGGLAFDEDRNLWIANNGSEDILKVKTIDGNWYSYYLGGGSSGANTDKITVDSYGQIWMIIRLSAGGVSKYEILVFDPNNTLDEIADDKIERLTNKSGEGALPGDNKIFTVASDRDGEIWIGSDKGPAVIYTPENIFNGGNFDAQRILINRNDGTGLADILLENEAVNYIEIDGANRKWFATENAGVFLMSADGTEQIHHFTAENSPLLSNSVKSISITDEGLVFFGTNKGIVSYKSDAIPPPEDNTNLRVYPNPIPPGYSGNINISDIVENAEVRIMDISGNLVFVTQSAGGLAVWNGNNMNGERVNSGVYLVFVSDESGNDTNIGKILFLK